MLVVYFFVGIWLEYIYNYCRDNIRLYNIRQTYKFRGSLCADFDYEGTDLSDLVRETVGISVSSAFYVDKRLTEKLF